MTYLEKEARMLQEMERTHYANMGGEEKKEMTLSFMGMQFDTFISYANTVITQQVMTPLWKVMYEGQEFRDKVESLDRTRRLEHDAAIGGVRILNQMSEKLGLEPFADIDVTDRFAVADFIGTYVNEVYRDKEYDVSKSSEAMIKEASQSETLEEAINKLQRGVAREI